MTHKIRNTTPTPKFFSESSATSKYHHKIVPQHQFPYKDDDNTDNSQSLYGSNEDELEQPSNDDNDDDASYTDSESKSLLRTNNAANLLQTNFQATSYINVAPLPVFLGTCSECPVTHLSRFTKVCRANNASSIDMMMRIFPVTLENEAALWYDLNIEPYPLLSWKEIKSSFLQAYHKMELVDQLRYELMMINQGSQESVRSYFLRLQWILKRWPDHGIPDNLLKGIFIDGLRQDFQDWIIPQKPDSLNEALRLAFGFEQVKSIKASRTKELKCGFCEGSHEEMGCEIRERMRVLWGKNKDKILMDYSENNRSNNIEAAKEIVTLFSVGERSAEGKNEGKEEGEMLSGIKKSQCQCLKHQCSKKHIERNNSLVTMNS